MEFELDLEVWEESEFSWYLKALKSPFLLLSFTIFSNWTPHCGHGSRIPRTAGEFPGPGHQLDHTIQRRLLEDRCGILGTPHSRAP